MAPENDNVQRELGAIGEHLRSMDIQLKELVVQARSTNGRVGQHEIDLAVLKDRDSRVSALASRLTSLEARPRIWILGVGVPLSVALLEVALTGHAFV